MSTTFYLITVESAIAAPAGDLVSLGSPRGSGTCHAMCHFLLVVWCLVRHAVDWPALASPGFSESALRLDSELALLAAWTQTCSAYRLHTNLLCPLQLSSRSVEFPVSQFPWSRQSISSWGRSAIVLFLLSRRRDFTVHIPHTPDISVASAGG